MMALMMSLDPYSLLVEISAPSQPLPPPWRVEQPRRESSAGTAIPKVIDVGPEPPRRPARRFPVGVGLGRGAWIAPGPFPQTSRPNRTCDFHRIRLSTSLSGLVRALPFWDHGVGMRAPRNRYRMIGTEAGLKSAIPSCSGSHPFRV
jgi:hypothetical protein